MTILEAILLAILQGVTDFLPISTSGHLLLFQRIFGHEEGRLTFIIVLHAATLIPVLFVYYNRIRSMVKNPFQKMTLLLILGTVPTVIAALVFGDFIETLFTGNFLPLGFLITATILFITDRQKQGTKNTDEITRKDALCVGLAQAFAIMPGVSRSGSTIAAGVARGVDRESAANFSFLLSIPATIGAVTLELRHVLVGQTEMEFMISLPVVIGFFVAMIACYISIKVMLKIVVAGKLRYFSYYLVLLAVLILIDQNVTHIVF
ncbi:MAG: undecaprenyl-diphosphate phosphatase [Oscillospiraceae bacterium]|nr:undecaprenyl-diphosphate phosphatase [Oscillospiraceae bacterium]